MEKRKYEKAYGCLAGVAVGDAMGMPTSGYTPEKIKERFGHVEEFLPAPEGHLIHGGMNPAEVTDDTKLTMMLANSIIEHNQVLPERFVKKLVNWAVESDLLDTGYFGPSTNRALKRIKNGAPIEETGKLGTTNGAAMKISPVGIFNAGKLEKAADDAARVSMPTHGSSPAIAGACAVACAVAEGMKPESDSDSVIGAAKKGARIGKKRGAPVFSAPVDKRIELALRLVGEVESPEKITEHLYNYIGCGMESNESIPASIALVYVCDGDPMKSIITATNMGGDADTISSIVGGICGSLRGIKAIPSRLVKKVEKVNDLNLSGIASKLVNREE